MSLLEINVISAQDLPPLAKVLRTFAVVYMSPDHKLTTKVDHQGHTNPTWNYKIAFHIDEKFLKQESSAITIEIYNVAWLRDLPIGTTRLFINNLSPPLTKNPNFRRVSLQIARPSGHLQGTLNLGVQLVQDIVPSCELKVGPMIKNVGEPYKDDKIWDQDEDHDKSINDNIFIEEYLKDQVKNIPIITRLETMSEKENINIFTQENPITNMIEPKLGPRTDIASTNSTFSMIRPLPTEVPIDTGNGVYTTDCNDYGSSLLENWTEPNSKEGDHKLRSKSVKWRSKDHIPLKHDRKSGNHHKTHSEKRQSRQKGLMSCFGNAYGFEFSIIFGSKTMKKKKNNNTKKNFHINLSRENTHGVYT